MATTVVLVRNENGRLVIRTAQPDDLRCTHKPQKLACPKCGARARNCCTNTSPALSGLPLRHFHHARIVGAML